MGLRERHKKRRRNTIHERAMKLFLEKGFTSTTMSEIAEAAEVSIGTLYNYYGSKNSLLLAIFDDQFGDAREEYLTLLDGDGADLIDTLASVYQVGFDYMLRFPRPFMRELMKAAMETEDPSFRRSLFRYDEEAIELLSSYLSNQQSKGRIQPGVDPMSAAWVIHSVFQVYQMLIGWFDDADVGTASERFRRDLKTIFTGLRPSGCGTPEG